MLEGKNVDNPQINSAILYLAWLKPDVCAHASVQCLYKYVCFCTCINMLYNYLSTLSYLQYLILSYISTILPIYLGILSLFCSLSLFLSLSLSLSTSLFSIHNTCARSCAQELPKCMNHEDTHAMNHNISSFSTKCPQPIHRYWLKLI